MLVFLIFQLKKNMISLINQKLKWPGLINNTYIIWLRIQRWQNPQIVTLQESMLVLFKADSVCTFVYVQ